MFYSLYHNVRNQSTAHKTISKYILAHDSDAEDDTNFDPTTEEIAWIDDVDDISSDDIEIPEWLTPKHLIASLYKSCPSSWQSEIKELVDKSKKTFSSDAIKALDSLLQQRNSDFRSQETNVSHRNIQHLIYPSGSLASPILLKLHYPSFSTSHPLDGETADTSSPCPRILMDAGFSSNNALWIQAYYRRETPDPSRKSPMRNWPLPLKALHEKHANWHEENSESSIRILFGRHNRTSDLRRENTTSFDVCFPGGVSIKASLHSKENVLHHITLYANHPEYLFRNPSVSVGMEYDAVLGLAASLGDIPQFKFGFFTVRARKLEKLGILGREVGDNALHDTIQLLKAERMSGVPIGLENVPSSVKRWLTQETGVSEENLGGLVSPGGSIVEYSHQKMVSRGGIVKAENERRRGLDIPSGLDQIRQANRAKDSKLQRQQNSSSSHEPSVVRVRCAKCESPASEFDDKSPTWDKSSGKYVARKRSSCRTQGCCDTYLTKKQTTRRKEVDFIPVDNLIQFVYARNLSSKN